MNFIIFVSSKFGTKLLAANHLIIWDRTKFYTEQISSKFLLEIMTLVKKVKWSRYRPGVAQRVGRGIALLFHDCGTRRGWVVSSTPWPHFIPRNIIKIAMYRRLGGPQGWSGRAENLIPIRARSRTVQPVVSRYTDSATQPTMTLVASPNSIGSHIEFIFRGRSLYIYYEQQRIYNWSLENSMFQCTPVTEKVFSCIRWFYFNFLSSVS